MREVRYSENPNLDIWKRLHKFSYGSNIKSLFAITDDSMLDEISGSIIQANEYFTASSSVSLNTSPLLMYYGCVNLLYAAAIVLTKNKVQIENHGASLTLPDSGQQIGNAAIHLSASEKGAFRVFNKVFSGDVAFPQTWNIRDVLGYIPEIKADFEECYADAVATSIPVEIVKRRKDKLERIRLSDLKKDFDQSEVVDFESTYLAAQKTNEYIILREKLGSKELGHYSINGQKNLATYSVIGGKKYYLNQIIALFLGLYSLSVLSRYHPGRWYPFVQKDDTGERGLVEDFLSIASRKLPNLVLNLLSGKEIEFQYQANGLLDLSKDYDPEDVKKIVREEIRENRFGA